MKTLPAITYLRGALCLFLGVLVFQVHAVAPIISAGPNASLFLDSDGSVWGAGNVTNYGSSTSPVPVLQLPNLVAVATGGGADFALLADGTVWGVRQQ